MFTQEEKYYLKEIIYIDLKHTFIALSDSYLKVATKVQGFTLADCKKDFKATYSMQLNMLNRLDTVKYNALLEYIKNFRYTKKSDTKYRYLYS